MFNHFKYDKIFINNYCYKCVEKKNKRTFLRRKRHHVFTYFVSISHLLYFVSSYLIFFLFCLSLTKNSLSHYIREKLKTLNPNPKYKFGVGCLNMRLQMQWLKCQFLLIIAELPPTPHLESNIQTIVFKWCFLE